MSKEFIEICCLRTYFHLLSNLSTYLDSQLTKKKNTSVHRLLYFISLYLIIIWLLI